VNGDFLPSAASFSLREYTLSLLCVFEKFGYDKLDREPFAELMIELRLSISGTTDRFLCIDEDDEDALMRSFDASFSPSSSFKVDDEVDDLVFRVPDDLELLLFRCSLSFSLSRSLSFDFGLPRSPRSRSRSLSGSFLRRRLSDEAPNMILDHPFRGGEGAACRVVLSLKRDGSGGLVWLAWLGLVPI
jgi:hypothetical protein